MPRSRGLIGAAPGVAYVIGEDGPDRERLAAALREMTDLAVVAGVPSKATLTALGSRNVKLIAASASCLESLAFRNEFALRCRQPKLSSVPVLLFGSDGAVSAAARSMPAASALAYRPADDIGPRLRRQLEEAIGGETSAPELTAV